MKNKLCILQDIADAEKYHAPAHRRMLALENVVRYGYDSGESGFDSRVMATLRRKFGAYHLAFLSLHLELLATALYSRNPELEFKRTRRMNYKAWDGEEQTLMDAFNSIEQAIMAGMPPDPLALEILDEVVYVDEINDHIDRQGETLTLLASSYMNDPTISFREKLNSCVKDIGLHGGTFVGCVPVDDSQMGDILGSPHTKVAAERKVKYFRAMAAREVNNPEKKEKYEKRAAMVEAAVQFLPRTHTDSVHFDFVKAYNLIPDKDCTTLQGMKEAKWIAVRHWVSEERLLEAFPELVGKEKADYSRTDIPSSPGKDTTLLPVYLVFDQRDYTYSVVSPCYPKIYIREPITFPVASDNFYPYVWMTWREPEQNGCLYPVSDVEKAASSQAEVNMIKTLYMASLLLNVPRYMVKKGSLTAEDAKKLNDYDPLGVVEIGVQAFDQLKAGDLFTSLTFGSPSQADYNPAIARQQINAVLGVSEASFGVVSEESATASSLAADGAKGLLDHKRWRFDECLANLARLAGGVMMRYATPDQVLERVGEGAVWFPPEEVDFSSELYLTAKTGTSGHLNSNEMLAKIERIANLIIQIPGFPIQELKTHLLNYLGMDPQTAAENGMPSIIAMNAMQNKIASAAELNQGSAGALNAPNAQASTNALPEMTAAPETKEKANV